MCPKCNITINAGKFEELKSRCLRMLNSKKLKDSRLVRLDDWYTPEIKEKKKTESGYWISTEVKTDRDNDTVIVVYVGHKSKNEKVQFFIKPEKRQLLSDHKDMDPSKVLSKIEVTFKDRKLSQIYNEKE